MTRLAPPRTHQWVVNRPRLVGPVLDPAASLVIVCGPAGVGKSTVMAQAHAASENAVWLSIDEVDNDPTRLWLAMSDAIAALVPDFGRTYRRQLQTARSRIEDRVLSAMEHELAEVGQPIRLFIDDLHLLTGKASQRSFWQFVEQRPADVAFVIAGRGAPSRLLPKRLRTVEMTVVDQDDLAMDPTEIWATLEAHDVQPGCQLTETLLSTTEGWTAGVRWAAMALQNRLDPDRFIESAASLDGDIGQYFVEEVLRQLPEKDRLFMLETSILRHLSAELCDAVRERTDSGRRLAKLDRSTALVIGTGQDDQWYRYHHLFREVLLGLLEEEMPGRRIELHRRAADWLGANGDVEEAIFHACAAGEKLAAADMLCASWLEFANSGRLETARALFDLFDQSELHSYQPLSVAAAFHFAMVGDDQRSRSCYRVALAGSHSGPPPNGAVSMDSAVALMRAALVYDGVYRGLRAAERAYGLEPPSSPWRSMAALLVGLNRSWSGDREGATDYFGEVLDGGDPDEVITVYALAETALTQLERGDVELALANAETASRRASDAWLDDIFVIALARGAAALCQIAVGDKEAARTHLEAAAASIDALELALPVDAMRTRLLLAEAAIELGLFDLAEHHLDGAEASGAKVPDAGVLDLQLPELRARLQQTMLANNPPSLSARELEVLSLLPTDLSVQEIAHDLFVSRETVRSHLRRIYRELAVGKRSEAVVEARRRGLLPDQQA